MLRTQEELTICESQNHIFHMCSFQVHIVFDDLLRQIQLLKPLITNNIQGCLVETNQLLIEYCCLFKKGYV